MGRRARQVAAGSSLDLEQAPDPQADADGVERDVQRLTGGQCVARFQRRFGDGAIDEPALVNFVRCADLQGRSQFGLNRQAGGIAGGAAG